MSVAARGRFAHTKFTIDSTNRVLIVHDGTAERTCTLATGDYFIRGDGVSTTGQKDLISALLTALLTAPGMLIADFAVGVTLTAGSASLGKVTIYSTGGSPFELRWAHASSTFANAAPSTALNGGAYLGFVTTANDTGAATYTSDYQAKGLWFPEIEGSVRDNIGVKLRRTAFAISGASETRLWGDGWDRYEVRYEYLARTRIKEAYSATNVALDAGLLTDLIGGGEVLWWPDNTDTATVHRVVLDDNREIVDVHDFAQPVEGGASAEVYNVVLRLRDYVAP
jgi:hypothetical protein